MDVRLYSQVATPSYVIDRVRLRENLSLLGQISQQSGARILLAQKAFSSYDFYPDLQGFLQGTAASGLFEARLGREYFPAGEVHVYSPAFTDREFGEVLQLADVVVFNSLSQWRRYRDRLRRHNASAQRPVSAGLRLNPGYSEVKTGLYNPAGPGSRLGVTAEVFFRDFQAEDLQGLEGLHVHALCEDSAETLERMLQVLYAAFADRMASWPGGLRWFNLGGGHHITRPGYNTELLLQLLHEAAARSGAQVYLEPGEAVALNAGVLVSRVEDVLWNGLDLAVLDSSAVCHMPDVIEMPYRPQGYVLYQDGQQEELGEAGEKSYTYRLGGPSCLAGDLIGDYSLTRRLEVGDRLVFLDMAIYTTVKTNTFNGMPLPALWVREEDGLRELRRFGYEDFRDRLGSLS